jgi:anti-sigma regulatory factor (Ser/Thr protein kinase)
MVFQAHESTVSLVLPAEPASVRAARQVLRDFAEEAGADAEAVAIAVSEAVTNAVQHAYPDGEGEIWVRAGTNDVLRINVSDHGQGFVPRPRSSDRPHLGLPLIGQTADEYDVRAGPEGVDIEMRFGLAG